MTVCIAAMSIFPTDDKGSFAPIIVGASDRMITAGDVEFEPQLLNKVLGLTSSIVIMIAGDVAMQTELVHELQATVSYRVQAAPSEWLTVNEVAALYIDYYHRAVRRRTEGAILAPLGLDHDSFIEKQRRMSPSLVTMVAKDLVNFEAPTCEAIITGIDDTGAHIISIENGRWSNRDTVGFAAIGAGYWHANSQFMFAKHHRAKLFPETLLLTYAAKKRAEVAPGVGEGTDLFTIGPEKGRSGAVNEELSTVVDTIYREGQQEMQAAAERSVQRMNEHVIKVIRDAIAAAQAAAVAGQAPDQSSGPGIKEAGPEKGTTS